MLNRSDLRIQYFSCKQEHGPFMIFSLANGVISTGKVACHFEFLDLRGFTFDPVLRKGNSKGNCHSNFI